MAKINYTDEDLVHHEGVAAVIKNKKGQILMQDHVKYSFWTLPVGKTKYAKDIFNGLKTELSEECGIIVEECKEIAKKRFEYIRNGKKVVVRLHLFEITKYSGTVKNKEPHKHRLQEFMELEEIKRLPYLSDATLLYLKTLGFERKAKISAA
jgi:ADP-ribose pyrophosphatase YjhB (NUDIX family)